MFVLSAMFLKNCLKRMLVPGLVMVALSGCAERNLDDRVMSWVSGQDCSGARAESGGLYCVTPQPPPPTVAQRAFCYNTLADINCYKERQAMDSGSFVGEKVANVPVVRR